MEKKIEIYQSEDGHIQIDVQLKENTVWLTQKLMASLFETTIPNVNMHLKNIYEEGELSQESTIKDFLIVQMEGKRKVQRKQIFYNLDAIISLGYRVKSGTATQFRIWATKRIKELLTQGYALNEKRLTQKEQEVKVLKSGIQIMARALTVKSSEEGMEWLDMYAVGLGILDDYDHEALDIKGKNQQKAIFPTLEKYQELVELMRKEFDSDVFGKEKDSNFRSSVGQITKGFGDEDFYSSIEEKAAMLLYFITKNHSFVDGNKRIAAACFLYFLKRNNLLINDLGFPIISNEALASLTLYVAASKSEEMETVKRLIVSVLNRNQV